MQPQFEPADGYCLPILLCPGCGFEYLHHVKVEVFDRNEDDEKGAHVVVKGRKVGIDLDLDGNPSSRRDGLRIEFVCEGCPAVSALTLAQHKGRTEVKFVVVGSSDDKSGAT